MFIFNLFSIPDYILSFVFVFVFNREVMGNETGKASSAKLENQLQLQKGSRKYLCEKVATSPKKFLNFRKVHTALQS